MTIRTKISVAVFLLFTFVFTCSVILIYAILADFRRDEFEKRLKEKAITSMKLLLEVKEVNQDILEIIEKHSVHKLYEEKTLIFDSTFQLIHSNLEGTVVKWSKEDLLYLQKNHSFFREEDNTEILGYEYKDSGNSYYVIIAASDLYGKGKLRLLLNFLAGIYIIFTIISYITISYLVKRLFRPIMVFLLTIRKINEDNLETRIKVKSKKDEIDLLADEFNKLLGRLDISYQKQKEFTANASHELRTPLARILSQIESLKYGQNIDYQTNSYLDAILKDIKQMSELISSLLLLTKIDSQNHQVLEQVIRIDELIYNTNEKVTSLYPDFKLQLALESEGENELEIKGNKTLLEVAFFNLFKNSYLYSDNKKAIVTVIAKDRNVITVLIENNGAILSKSEQDKIFEAFMRGNNSRNKAGLGLGLRIISRILRIHHAEIKYGISEQGLNQFIIHFYLPEPNS